MLRFYGAAVRGAAVALVRRAVYGRPHTEWTLSYEVAMAALRVVTREHPDLMAALARTQVAPLPRKLAGLVKVEQARYAGLDVEVHTPRDRTVPNLTLLYFHGGGFVTGSPRSHRDVIARIAHASGARCIAPDYRLAPEHPFPAALDDAVACYRALLEQGHAPEHVFIGGDSAGGGLALAALVRLRDEGTPLPRASVLLSPWVDLSLDTPTLEEHGARGRDYQTALRLPRNARTYAQGRSLCDPYISPIYAQFEGLPPLLVQSGEWEMFCEQNLRLVALARAAGVDVDHSIAPGMLHAFTCFAGLSEQGRLAIAEIGCYLRDFARGARNPERSAGPSY